MVLIDSSSWIESLRLRGRMEVRQRVAAVLERGDAAWCNMIRLELWNGARGDREKRTLRDFEAVVVNLQIDEEVWKIAIALADRARKTGLSAPAGDLVILACARRHQVAIEHCDDHFRLLEQLA